MRRNEDATERTAGFQKCIILVSHKKSQQILPAFYVCMVMIAF